jgi:hypothetical protein
MSSPPEKRSTAVEHIVLNSDAVELPLLTKTNYQEWSMIMHVSLEAMELWDVVEAASKDCAKDQRVLAAILHVVPSEMKVGLAVKKSAKEAWDMVKLMRVGDDRVKSVSLRHLLKEYENDTFRDGEFVDDFVIHINGLVASLCELDEEVEDSRVVRKIMRVILKKLRQVGVAIEMLTDLNTMTVEQLVDRLHVAEVADAERCYGRCCCGSRGTIVAHRGANTIKEEVRGIKGDGHNGGHGEDDDNASTCLGGSRGAVGRYRGRCYNCNKRGYIVKFCPECGEKAMMAEADEESVLL